MERGEQGTCKFGRRLVELDRGAFQGQPRGRQGLRDPEYGAYPSPVITVARTKTSTMAAIITPSTIE